AGGPVRLPRPPTGGANGVSAARERFGRLAVADEASILDRARQWLATDGAATGSLSPADPPSELA
ncbi:hypothetical protein, partial [Candidatus Synechococcus spongiarum]|uniref:hypothetical protein n=1 Tax=Candidatus Synechococcus spongiarum TaxID=431041 RepID=UPI001378CC4D